MKEEEVIRCQIQKWYPKFKSISIRTIVHKLPENFVQYLIDNSGPFVLPQSVFGEDALPRSAQNPEEQDDFQVFEGSDDESEQPPTPPCFEELELEVKKSIEILGGAIFPKLNWSAPKDSAWISTTSSLRCTSFSEIVLLLKSSETLTHDLCHAFDSCVDRTRSRPSKFFIALRKWYPSFHPDMEFRCFIRNHVLVGISQREITGFYPCLLDKKYEIEVSVKRFFIENIQERFGSENYTFDIYITRDWRIKLMDFNPWGSFTLPLLFSWEELESNFAKDGNDFVEFRIVESQGVVRPGLKTAVPYDYLDTSTGSGWDQVFRKLEEDQRKGATCLEASS